MFENPDYAQQLPNYTKQLDAIVTALNRPTAPAWQIAVLCALLCALLGFLSSTLGHPLQKLLADMYERRKMRRVIYLDLIDNFWLVHAALSFEDIPEDQRYDWQRGERKTSHAVNTNLFLRQCAGSMVKARSAKVHPQARSKRAIRDST